MVLKIFFIGIEFGVVAAAIQGKVDCVDYISHLIVGSVLNFQRKFRTLPDCPLLCTSTYALFWADEITVSAPRGRVDLEALKRPRLGGKEPSDDDYRV